jgi:hypothetical protein
MNKAFLVVWIMLCCRSDSRSQTNATLVESNVFCLPQLQLGLPVLQLSPSTQSAAICGLKEFTLASPLPTQPDSTPASTTNAVSFTNTLNLAASETFSDVSPYPTRDLGRFLTKRDPESLSLLRHPVDAIFEPESLRLGKVTFSCSIVTAIKRRDPLCLLNPAFLGFSW